MNNSADNILGLNIEDIVNKKQKLQRIWKLHKKGADIPTNLLKEFFDFDNEATKAGRLHDLLSITERAFNLEPIFTSPLLSAPTYLSMISNIGLPRTEDSSSLMLGSLGVVSAMEHDMIANSLGVSGAHHIDKLQVDSSERYRKVTGRDSFSIQDAASTNFLDNSFSFVIFDYLFRVISIQLADDQHILTRVMKEAYRVLKPGGIILILDQQPEWASKRGFDPARYTALLTTHLEGVGFEKLNLHRVFKYRNRKIAYENFPQMNLDLMDVYKESVGIAAMKR